MPRNVNLDGYNLMETQVAEMLRLIDARTIGNNQSFTGVGVVDRNDAPNIVGPDDRILLSGRRGYHTPLAIVGGPGMLTEPISAVSACVVTRGQDSRGYYVRVQGTIAGGDAELRFDSLTGMVSGGDAYLLIDGSYTRGNMLAAVSYVSQDAAGYGKGWSNTIGYGYPNPLNNPYEQGGINTYWFKRASNTQLGSAPSYPAYVGEQKLRLSAVPGQLLDVKIYAYGLSGRIGKGRSCTVFDDGYFSSLALGFDSFASRGLPLTMAVIGSTVDTPGYVTTEMLKAFVAAGNCCVAHGPWPNSGQNNLFTAYPGSANPIADAIGDMERNRDFLAKNGLLVEGADRCYVWPQGVWQQVANNTALLDAALAKGFTFGRSATPTGYLNVDSLSRYNRLCNPIIGHTWSGTTVNENGADGTSNTAGNIFNIKTKMAEVAVARGDYFMMLHRVYPTSTVDGVMGGPGSITIRYSDLELLAAAQAAQVTAGDMIAVTMAQMACAPQSLWANT